MKLNLLYVSLLLTASSWVAATSLPHLSASANRESMGELLIAYQKENRRVRASLTQLTQALHRERNRSEAMPGLFGLNSQDKRNTKKIILKSTIELQLVEQKNISQNIAALQEQLQLMDLRQQLPLAKNTKKVDTKKSPFLCEKSPLPDRETLQILRDFGTQLDNETQMTWEHPGWLLQTNEGKLTACSEAVVSFAGNLNGMGNVLILRGPKNSLLTYAHLGEMDKAVSVVGAKVHSGQVLARTTTRLYIEVRQNGTALNPGQALGPKLSIAR